jgi:hypothetical protein
MNVSCKAIFILHFFVLCYKTHHKNLIFLYFLDCQLFNYY